MDPEPLFQDFITVQGHKFLVTIDHDGYIEFDDHEGRVGRRAPADRQLELRAAAGDPQAQQRLAHEQTEFGIRLKLDPATFAHFQEWESIHDAGFSSDQRELEIDAILEQIFWRDINPFLIHPLPHPDRTSP